MTLVSNFILKCWFGMNYSMSDDSLELFTTRINLSKFSANLSEYSFKSVKLSIVFKFSCLLLNSNVQFLLLNWILGSTSESIVYTSFRLKNILNILTGKRLKRDSVNACGCFSTRASRSLRLPIHNPFRLLATIFEVEVYALQGCYLWNIRASGPL